MWTEITRRKQHGRHVSSKQIKGISLSPSAPQPCPVSIAQKGNAGLSQRDVHYSYTERRHQAVNREIVLSPTL